MPTRPETLASALEDLAVHDHLCLIYESREEQFAAVVPFVRHGLAAGQRCVYIADDNTAESVAAAIRGDGIDVDAQISSGALQILTKREAYLRNGSFDPDEMIAFLAEATAAAKADGLSALRVTGEMTWVLGGEPGTERLFEYEAKLNYFLADHDALAICQYSRRRFAADVVLDVIRTHPVVIFGDLVCDNFHYVPPDDFLLPDLPDREVDRLLSSISDAERARQALEQASRHWSATFDALNDMVCLLARDGTVLRCNQAASSLLGLGKDEVVGKKVYEVMHGSNTFFEKCPYQEMLRSGKRESFELTLGERWYQVTADPLFGKAEEIVGAVHVVRDITETKAAQVSLAEESRWLTAVNALALELAAMPSDADPGALLATRLREATGAAAVGFGIYDRQDKSVGPPQISFAPGVLELLSRPLRSRLNALRTVIDDDLYRENLTTRVRNLTSLSEATAGAIRPAVSATLQKLTGVDRFVAISHVAEGELYGSSLLALRAGTPAPPRELLETFANTVAVSLRRRRAEEEMRAGEAEIRALNASLEQRVRERTRELAAANQELQEFVYSVSHELRSPLRAIDGFSLTVLEDYRDVLDERGRSDLQRVRSAAQRMGELIDALLSLSRLGRREIDRREVDLSAVARRVVDRLREAEPGREVDVTIEDGLVAEADPALLDVVLENLLVNAWKFSASRPVAHIELGTVRRDGRREFFVRDDGVGFDPAYVDKLFTPFQRLHAAEQFAGHGIGLASVARVLGRLGGTWRAEGEIDRGATFSFTLSGGDLDPPQTVE